MTADPQTAFLGTGWAFPVRRNQGDVAMVSAEDLIAQSIWLILSTAPGERVQRPDFGCGIHELVFAPSTSTTAGRVADAVRDALIRLEPRIDVLSVETAIPEGRSNVLMIEIDYRVRSTNNRFNLVYPFYVEGIA
jgi:Bacteriophage baseplate protein W